MSENQPGPHYPDLPPPGQTAPLPADGAAQTRVAQSPFQVSQEPVTGGSAHDTPVVPPATVPAYEYLGELPASYGTQSVYLVAYDPRQLFAYWDLSPADTSDKKYSLRICHAGDGGIETQFDIAPAEAGRYVAAQRPGGAYYVELGTHSRNGAWQSVATSGRVTLPPEGLAAETEAKFATLPFHLSFQRLIDLIDRATGTREELAGTLARLQRGERPALSSLLGALSHLSADQLRTLEMLLSAKFALDSTALVAAGAEGSIFRDRSEILSSPGQSSAGFSPGAGFGSESLAAGGAFGSEALSSAAGGFGSENLSSLIGGLFGSENVSSFSSLLGSEGISSLLGGPSSESLSSFSGLGGMSSESLSSFGRGFGSDTLSSLLGGFGSSETLSSGGPFGSESLLSFLAGMSSDTLSSFFTTLAGSGGGSESLGSPFFGFGPSSEAWRLAGSLPGLSSVDFSSETSAVFLRALENNLDVLSSLFSPGGGGAPETLSSPGGSSSEDLTKRKSLW